MLKLGQSLTRHIALLAAALVLAVSLFALAPLLPAATTGAWQAGAAREKITPAAGHWMTGFTQIHSQENETCLTICALRRWHLP